MSPNLEEAWRSLRLADRDIRAFEVLNQDGSVHLSVVCFHAQQAVEKSLKAVLFARRIESRRTHSLTELASLLQQHGIESPVADDYLLRLNPYAVTFRYDDVDIQLISRKEVADLVTTMRQWAEDQVTATAHGEEGSSSDKSGLTEMI